MRPLAIGLVTGPTALVDPSGGHVPNAHAWDDGGVPIAGGVRVHTEWYWPRQGSGTYRLVVGPGEGPHLVRPIDVP